MNRIVRSLLVVVPLLALAAPAGRTQAAAPSGRQLIAQMQAAIKAKGSYHLQGSITVHTAGQPTARVTMLADISTTPQEAHATITSHTLAGPVRVEEILVGKRLALRTGSAAWHCRSLTSATHFLQSLTGTPQLTKARTLGSGTIQGRAVWRVQTVEAIQLLGRAERIKQTYFIAQDDHTLLQEQSHPVLHLNNATAHEQIRFIYSQYGEAVHATLPAACHA